MGGNAQFLLVTDTRQDPPVPIPIKLGDVNQDGFPDILAILASGTGSHSDHTPRLAYSVPCGKGRPGCSSDGSGHRGWSVLQKGGEVLSEIKDARSIAFLDMDEDVSLFSRSMREILTFGIRARWTSWSNAQEVKGRETLSSFRTTSTMMRSSSRR